ncbi:CCA tRNA nucleotidyltransferase [Chlamydiia bacterium]|nr:CCA tRNA nucleotidyltransferase [Chlamydiia bacterium]
MQKKNDHSSNLNTIDKLTHKLEIKQFDPNAISIIKKLTKNGHEAYLVGGCVRDLILGVCPKDYDIATSATPEEVKGIFRRQCLLIGKRFRLAHVRFDKNIYEVATYRNGENNDSSIIQKDNLYGNLEQDAQRRDFTINAMYYSPINETITQYTNGFEDLKEKKLSVIGEPDTRFKQDPVRLMRLVISVAKYDLNIDHDVWSNVCQNAHLIQLSSKPRVFEEIMKILLSEQAALIISKLNESGIFQNLFKDIALHYDYSNHDNAIKQFTTSKKSELDEGNKKVFVLTQLLETYISKNINKLEETRKRLNGQIIKEFINKLIKQALQPFQYIPKRIKNSILIILTTHFINIYLTPKHKRSKILYIEHIPAFKLYFSDQNDLISGYELKKPLTPIRTYNNK